MRSSKAALRAAAELLGTTTASARTYLRTVQHVVGHPVAYETIVRAIRDSADRSAEAVADRIRASQPTEGGSGSPSDPPIGQH